MKSKNILIVLCICLVVFFVGYFSNEREIVKTKTEVVTKYDTITKTIDNTKPTKIEKVYIKVPVKTHDTVTRVVFKDKPVNKYTYIDTVKNGRLESVILADTIYKRSIKLDVYNKETVKTITNTIVKSSVMLGVDTNINGGIQQSSLNMYYINKDKWLVKAGLGYDFTNTTHFYSVGIAIKF